jgi:hypothetical protein
MGNSSLQPYKISEIKKGVLTATVTKRVSVNEFMNILIDMKQNALKININKLLIDASSADYTGFNMSERHDYGLAAVEILKGDFRTALVAKKQFINKHGENVANNRGAHVLVTDNVDEAYEWLLK